MPASDRDIWQYAKQHGLMVITFDEDFEELANLNGFPPKVIVLRIGNTSTAKIAEVLLSKITEIEAFDDATHQGLLEIY
jgi:predicted nuclease of predicted toxin-antitoxin system